MVFIQIIHSQSGSFHSPATGSPLKPGTLCADTRRVTWNQGGLDYSSAAKSQEETPLFPG